MDASRTHGGTFVRINTNVNAINAQRNLNSVGVSLSKSIERLSSGLRINRAGDDAAGLTITKKLLNGGMSTALSSTSEIQQGRVGGASSIAISNVSVAGAQANTVFTFSA